MNGYVTLEKTLTLGVNRHAMHTRADKLIVTDIEVILSGT